MLILSVGISVSGCTPTPSRGTTGGTTAGPAGLTTGGGTTGGLGTGGLSGDDTVGAQGGTCPADHPTKVPTAAGFEQIYDVCTDAYGTDSLIINRSSGVLRIRPGLGVLGLSVTQLATDDAAVAVARDVIDTGPDTTGAVLIPEATEADIRSGGAWTVNVALDTPATSQALLAKSFGQYAVDKFTTDTPIGMANDLKGCVTSAQSVWGDTNSLNDGTAISEGLTTAVDGYGSCRSFLAGIDAGAGAEGAASEAEETSGLVKAAGEAGSGFWKNLLELSLKDGEGLVKLAR